MREIVLSPKFDTHIAPPPGTLAHGWLPTVTTRTPAGMVAAGDDGVRAGEEAGPDEATGAEGAASPEGAAGTEGAERPEDVHAPSDRTADSSTHPARMRPDARSGRTPSLPESCALAGAPARRGPRSASPRTAP